MMASVVVGGNRRKSLTLRGVDPETCMIVFKNHWAQVVKILEKHEPARPACGAFSFLSGHSAGGSAPPRLGVIPADEASAVQNYVEHMLFLLMEEEAGQGGAMGPILEFVVVEGVMERLFLWSLRRQFTEDMKLEQLRMYQMLLSQARQPLLHHKPVLRPLMMLLASCAGAGTGSGGVVEAELVLLLHQLCAALVKDPSVLELFFHTSEDQGAANFLLFSLLIPYTHRQGSVGQQAREALLLIMSLSASEPRVAQHIADNTYFCPVLATGLSGLYSSLPARLQVYSEDWHFLDQADWQQVPALVHFLHSLDFCSAVTKVAHPSIRLQLLGYIYNGFLVPVLAPALHKLTVEEVMTTTAYLDLFLRSIAEPALLQTFLSFILLHTHDNVHILDTLVSRVNTPFQLGTVSLALFRTLIGLFCEDVMLQLVFRYLIPCSHLSRRQRCSLDQTHCLSSCAASFLLLTPSWCPLHLPHTHTEHIHWPQGADPSVSDSVAFCRGSDFLMDVNYLHYLWDARLAISTARRACRLWSAPYNGIDPPPGECRPETPGCDREEEDEMADDIEQQDKSNSVCSVCPTSTLSSTSSISDTVSTGNQAGRAGSVLELEWDDMFLDDDAASSTATTAVLTNGGVCVDVSVGADRRLNAALPVPPLLPPQHIQEMRRNATMLVHGLYVEETEFQDDVLVYDLVAQKDAKVAMLDRMAASCRTDGNILNGQRTSALATIAMTGKTVMDTINSIMSLRRRSEDGAKEGRRSSEDHGKDVRSRKKGADVDNNLTEVQGEQNGKQSLANGFSDKKDIISECDYSEEEEEEKTNCELTSDDKPCTQNCNLNVLNANNHHTHTQHHNTHRHDLPNGHAEFESHEPSVTDNFLPVTEATNGDDFLSQYRELMLSLGVEPDGEEITDIGSFRRRIRALRERQEEEGLGDKVYFNWLWDDGEDDGEEVVLEEEEEEEGETGRSSRRKSSRKREFPFTGPFISVLLSRLENLLENSIAVNLLVTGILAQLASYPQPLLKLFLLNTHTHYQPTVRTLYQVLVSVRAQIERYVSARPDYPALLTEAWRFLLAKDQDSKIRECLQSQDDDITVGGPLPNGSLSPPPLGATPPCPPIPPQARSRVFAIVLYAEFLKELAAIAQEHSIAPDGAAEE
ncbi:protein FAM160A1-like [Myripristis murdjan]|uniref:protein FAM160A1-like n=1 Tax=Myripristis murdjan TaxID=586833 RepID=UPI0011764945|nr:protein FAM160A1-like [Myripristis murdjan]XP_029931804.1 protein FAM160A1-like [Myripristis murdjan]XP_029931805.1 protein FAM160A1-like [Myripristis murdjan]